MIVMVSKDAFSWIKPRLCLDKNDDWLEIEFTTDRPETDARFV